MRMPVPADRELWKLIRSYVTPGRRHRELLHGNFLHRGRWQRFRFLRSLYADARRISDAAVINWSPIPPSSRRRPARSPPSRAHVATEAP
jgi:hypothetical protein